MKTKIQTIFVNTKVGFEEFIDDVLWVRAKLFFSSARFCNVDLKSEKKKLKMKM